MPALFNAFRLHCDTLLYAKFGMDAIANSYYKIVELQKLGPHLLLDELGGSC